MYDSALLIRLYHDQALSVDMLPYTPEIDSIVAQYNVKHVQAPIDHQTAYRRLMALRKNGKLIRRAANRTRQMF